MNGQVVPVSGTAGTGRMKENAVGKGRKGGRQPWGYHGALSESYVVHFAPIPSPPCSPLTPWWPILGIYLRNTTRQPPLLFTFLPSSPPAPANPVSSRTPSLRTDSLARSCVGVRGYRTGSSSLRGEPSWWRVAASFPPFGSRPRVFVRAEGESARTQIGQLRFRRERILHFFFPFPS